MEISKNNAIYYNIKKDKILRNKLSHGCKKICTLKAAKLLGKNQRRLKKWKDIPCSWAGRQCY